MRILLIISHLQMGGSETVVYNFIQLASRYSIDVKLAILESINLSQFNYLVPKDFYQYKSDTQGKFLRNISKLNFIRKSIKKHHADIVLSFIDSTNVLALLASVGLKIPVIISERNNPDRSAMSTIWFLLRRITYPFAHALAVANDGLRMHCERKHYNKNISIVPNVIRLRSMPDVDYGSSIIIAVGSLTQQKRFDLLIQSVSQLCVNQLWPDYKVHIFGEGVLRPDLEGLIVEKGLDEIIFLKGYSDNIMLEYQQASIFVLSSDYEGQPNVLLEAMSMGLACIATDCNYGPGELIDNNRNGFLVPVNDSQAMAYALGKLMVSSKLRKNLGTAAKEYIKCHFSEEAVMVKWKHLFDSLVRHP